MVFFIVTDENKVYDLRVFGGLARFAAGFSSLTSEEGVMFNALFPETLALIPRLKWELHRILQVLNKRTCFKT